MGRQLGVKPLIGVMDSLLLGKTLPCPVLASKSRYDLKETDSTFRLMQTAFGQGGTSVTPWQMALIVSAIANKGTLMEPYLVDKVLSVDGKTISSHSSKTYRKLFSEEEAAALSVLLRAVVTNGSAAELAGFPVACYGKTGSGEFTRSDGSRGTHAWFVGYAGVMDADVAFAVIAEDSGSGADVAVPIAHALLNAYYS
ncbi:MAG: penicillin-binding transpeptidase domain-containing protein [Lachnospiraceae bacterium]